MRPRRRVYAYDPESLAWTPRRTCPGHATPWRPASSTARSWPPGLGRGAGRRSTWVYDPAAGRLVGGGRRTGGALPPRARPCRRQALHRRRLHHGRVPADVERRGGVRPGQRQLAGAGRLPGLGGVRVLCRDRRSGLLHGWQRRQPRAPRRTPTTRRRQLEPGGRRPGRPVGEPVRRGRRHAGRDRWGPGRRDHQRGASPTTRPATAGSTCRTATSRATAAALPAGSTRSVARPEDFTATPDSEMLPGLEDCAAAGADVGWLSVDPTGPPWRRASR